MSTIDPTLRELADVVSGCLNTVTRVGKGTFMFLKSSPAPDGRTVTVEVQPVGFDTIGDSTRTLLLHLVYLDGEQTTPAVDPVIATPGSAA
jgi:hypothetical protein